MEVEHLVERVPHHDRRAGPRSCDAVEHACDLGVAGAGDIGELRGRLAALDAEVVNRWLDDDEIAPLLARYDLTAARRLTKAALTGREASMWRYKELLPLLESDKGVDVLLTKYHGLFYVAPTQNSYMCRLRIHNGILTHWQMAGLADLAERYGGGYSHVTTRANFQIREIEPKNAVAMVEAIQDLGLFFHPLDLVNEWKTVYGARGFVQYQFVVPFGREDSLRTAIETGARR